MPRGDKSSYTDKQKRKAEHIEEGYEKRGVSKDEAERRAWGDRQQGNRWRQQERLRPWRQGHQCRGEEGRPNRWAARRQGRGTPAGCGAITLGEEGRRHAQA
jgi:hypothetical protein